MLSWAPQTSEVAEWGRFEVRRTHTGTTLHECLTQTAGCGEIHYMGSAFTSLKFRFMKFMNQGDTFFRLSLL